MDPSRIERIKHLKNDMGYNVNSILGILGVSRVPIDEATYFPLEFKEAYTVDEFLPLMMNK
jgi:hypothetical protein